MKTQQILKRLVEIKRVCELNTARFNDDEQKDKEIKESIKLWVETWIKSPTEDIIKELEREKEKIRLQTIDRLIRNGQTESLN